MELKVETKKRLTLLPIEHHDLWDLYKKQENAFWHAEEIDLTTDSKNWSKLSKDEQHFIKYVLAFFASSDLIVADNLSSRFMREIKIIEAQCFYGIQFAIENIHSQVYSELIQCYIKDPQEKEFLFNAVETIPCIKKKADWAMKWIESSELLAERLIAFAVIEGIFFSGAFCSIFWLKQQNYDLPGLLHSNLLISRDEGIHTDFACLLYDKYIKNKLSDERVHEIVKEAVDLEIEFITDALPCKLLGINSASMSQYIKYVADRLLQMMHHTKIYGVEQPFPFMDKIGMITKGNFFEDKSNAYTRFDKKTDSNVDAYADL